MDQRTDRAKQHGREMLACLGRRVHTARRAMLASMPRSSMIVCMRLSSFFVPLQRRGGGAEAEAEAMHAGCPDIWTLRTVRVSGFAVCRGSGGREKTRSSAQRFRVRVIGVIGRSRASRRRQVTRQEGMSIPGFGLHCASRSAATALRDRCHAPRRAVPSAALHSNERLVVHCAALQLCRRDRARPRWRLLLGSELSLGGAV
ncbi:hypothetical protein CC85DRAFT_33141 [Cutaneotrichosporon oleaginosum]|uniref:Uncharacterized protein n=1 Tax=Cutaneotrichosporon oleaginosum TaxID=879819 RepID=A0A0J0XBJ8_9TREE|nr:uncharacterized protein CC85DRAFT_33141 [Cutaneotrichosporon oleaginosum]KLT38441.1 hypothetical protein CC85DRAFT_33141 [Cutaneotrichosporon oleaginosum]TXT08290.1 hypothetical protein COLE_05214 [Cutaneotrichosporon oleaginosum]